ncbi:MAG: hypothetical protein ACXIT9_08970 [Nitritalea sp.]
MYVKLKLFLILFGFFYVINIADARWFASMQAVKVYEGFASVESSISVSGDSIGLGGGSFEATFVGISIACGAALSSCDESKL